MVILYKDQIRISKTLFHIGGVINLSEDHSWEVHTYQEGKTTEQPEQQKSTQKDNQEDENITFEDSSLTHVHGLGYSTNGSFIMIPAHDGLKVFKEGKWGSLTGDKHDYMGFSVVNKGFYSSGYPAEGSSLKNPFGIVMSEDNGKSLNILDLHGEIDFHQIYHL
jgi:hypothetical protein